jgi:hypothetical protein
MLHILIVQIVGGHIYVTNHKDTSMQFASPMHVLYIKWKVRHEHVKILKVARTSSLTVGLEPPTATLSPLESGVVGRIDRAPHVTNLSSFAYHSHMQTTYSSSSVHQTCGVDRQDDALDDGEDRAMLPSVTNRRSESESLHVSYTEKCRRQISRLCSLLLGRGTPHGHL